jgi:hypothetical protein
MRFIGKVAHVAAIPDIRAGRRETCQPVAMWRRSGALFHEPLQPF